ncbi:pentapeptide repeat-containing protein [Leptolyngbya sp. NIES-2104]|uniref:pentapeptide repeat-containing protein n=1 Tax=Leptolyngbya sp. NIES-2104 TaxID=1552121 RepID=UPI00178CC8DB|nr:pentapeptide repeat-containing protein [Leptolyngbya sp. NIES-2104]
MSLVKDRIGLENTIDGSLVQAVGGLLLFVTAYVSLQNLKATQRNVSVAEEKQVTERFTQAINQLGNETSIYIQLGAIYALERIARDSLEDHWVVMEILTSFVREKSPMRDSYFDEETGEMFSEIENDGILDPVIQTALTVIGRRDARRDPQGVSLDLTSTALIVADLRNTNLTGANLSNVNLQEATLRKAELSLARFFNSKLYSATLDEANLTGAVFIDADLTGASFIGANLNMADFTGADLSKVCFDMANLNRAKFRRANLFNASLKNAQGLTLDQIKTARNWEKADYDEDFRQKLGLPPEQKS